MIRVINIKEEVLVTIEIVADVSYAWELIDRYITNTANDLLTPLIRKKIRILFCNLCAVSEIVAIPCTCNMESRRIRH